MLLASGTLPSPGTIHLEGAASGRATSCLRGGCSRLARSVQSRFSQMGPTTATSSPPRPSVRASLYGRAGAPQSTVGSVTTECRVVLMGCALI